MVDWTRSEVPGPLLVLAAAQQLAPIAVSLLKEVDGAARSAVLLALGELGPDSGLA